MAAESSSRRSRFGASAMTAGLAFGLLAPLLWSSSALFVKILPFAPIPLAAARSLIAGLALAPFWRFRNFRFTPELAVLVLSYTVTVGCYITALRLTTAANAIALQSTAPIWVLGLTWMAERRVRWLLAPPVGLVLVGVVVMLAEPAKAMANPRGVEGNAIALVAGAAFGLFSFYLPRVNLPAAGRIGLSNLGAGIVLFLASPQAFLAMHPTSLEWVGLLYLGAIQIAMATMFFAAAMVRLSVMQVSVLSLLEPILSPVWVYVAIGERPSTYGLAGGLCILAGIAADFAIRIGWPARVA
jgi:drug/metabolite transporter (DMT)-like permease